VSTHAPPHSEKPESHVTWQASDAVQKAVALVVVVHIAHTPPQQIPRVPHGVPSDAAELGAHVARPRLHEVIPSWHPSPAGTQGVPLVHVLHEPPAQTPSTSQGVPSATLPIEVQVGDPPSHDKGPVWQTAVTGEQNRRRRRQGLRERRHSVPTR
jgi:hypothetical protein